MEKLYYKKFKFLFFFVIFLGFSQLVVGQLSNFALQVTSTNETCTGNGSLSFTVSGITTGSSIDYKIYEFPNLISPIATLTTNALTGLNAGNYRVLATQSLNGNFGTQQQDVLILNSIQLLSYTLIGTKVRCGNDGKITVNIESGNPATYQIISGPVTTAVQNTSVFMNLTPGVYQVRVIDDCGEALVQTFTLLQATISLIIDPVSFPNPQLSTCDNILVSNFLGFLTGNEIAYPLTVEYTVFPPSGGTPLLYNQVIPFANSTQQIIPFYHNQTYFYDLKITDACGNTYNRNNNVINKKIDVTVIIQRPNCSDIALSLVPVFFVAPFSVSFLAAPNGFNPLAYNASHPGPFVTPFAVYGQLGNSLPYGNYSIQITDNCGRFVIKEISLQPQNPSPIAQGSNNGCGQITISIATIQLVAVVIVAAPNTYLTSLPDDVSEFINDNGNIFNITGLPIGNYTFQVTDSCGIIHTLQATIAPYIPAPLFINQKPGCENGYGSIKFSSIEGLSSVILINAPSTYIGTLPADLSSEITNNWGYLYNVPQGNYTFQLVNNCGAQRTETILVIGYLETLNSSTITENCGSFNLFFQHVSNGNTSQTFWLQKWNDTSNSWEHPDNGNPYSEGSQPNFGNSIAVINNTTNLNLAFNGVFRVLKVFQTYSSQGVFIFCFREIGNFEISDGPKIVNVYSFSCSSGTNEVIIDALGIPPLNYAITTKNSLPFIVNNGALNVFSNLEPGIYNFQVTDVCYNAVNSLFDISTPAALSIQSSVFCNGQNATLSVPTFSFLSYEWWKDNNTSAIISTSSQLAFTPFNQATDFGIYHVRIFNSDNPNSCINNILDYEIASVSNNPTAGNGSTVTYCGNQGTIDLFSLLSGTFDMDGTWEEITNSGTLMSNNWNSSTVASGVYEFKYRVEGFCSFFDESQVTITIKSIPETPVAFLEQVVCDTQSLNLLATTIPNGTYQWNGPNGFTSTEQNPVITPISSLNNGIYTVKVLENGCESGSSSLEVVVNSLPQFLLNATCLENLYLLTANPVSNSFDVNAVSYSWTGPNGFVSSENPTDISGLVPGDYILTITNTAGCTAFKTITVVSTRCTIPSGISPNNDGDNETFDLSGFEVGLNVKIFNRYGMTVFEQNNYTNQWRGQDQNNNELPTATYYYLIKFQSGETKSGWVYLIR